MFPINIDVNTTAIALVGNGPQTEKRLKLLREAGATNVTIYAQKPSKNLKQEAGSNLVEALPTATDIKQCPVIMIVDIEEEKAIPIAEEARRQKKLVNIEDNKPWCDFYFLSTLRRGDLLFGVSTNGKSPALAKRLRNYLADIFPEAWSKHVNEIGGQRLIWKKEGLNFKEVEDHTNQLINKKNWLN